MIASRETIAGRHGKGGCVSSEPYHRALRSGLIVINAIKPSGAETSGRHDLSEIKPATLKACHAPPAPIGVGEALPPRGPQN
jgi:hypothetical protein